jgi:hypothetical protein
LGEKEDILNDPYSSLSLEKDIFSIIFNEDWEKNPSLSKCLEISLYLACVIFDSSHIL